MPRERRFFESMPLLDPGSELTLSSENSHHATDVLRLSEGAVVAIVDRDSKRCFVAHIVKPDSSATTAVIIREGETGPAPSFVHSIYLPLLKANKHEALIERAVELGVSKIHIWNAERSVPKIGQTQLEKKLLRWNKISEGAAKQSGQIEIPQVAFCTGIDQLINTVSKNPRSKILVGSLSKEAEQLNSLPKPEERIQLVIGPEGGISDSETQHLINSGGSMISLGPWILRAETAAIAGIAGINLLWGAFE